MTTLMNKIPTMPREFGAKVGFINAPIDVVASELQAWQQELDFEPARHDLIGGIKKNAYLLLPLAPYPDRREILVATSNPEWTAYFDGSLNGGDVTSATSVLAKRLGVAKITVLTKPFQERSYSVDRSLGGLIFEYSPDGDYHNDRSIALVEGETSSSRYHFEAFGEEQSWEETERYGAKYKRDRITPKLIEKYCKHFNIDVFNLDFYSGPSVFFERTKFNTQ